MKNILTFAAGALTMLALVCFTGNVHASATAPATIAAALVFTAGVIENRIPSRRSRKTPAEPVITSQLELEVAQALKNMGATKAAAAAAAQRATKEVPAGNFAQVFKAAVQFSKEARA